MQCQMPCGDQSGVRGDRVRDRVVERDGALIGQRGMLRAGQGEQSGQQLVDGVGAGAAAMKPLTDRLSVCFDKTDSRFINLTRSLGRRA